MDMEAFDLRMVELKNRLSELSRRPENGIGKSTTDIGNYQVYELSPEPLISKARNVIKIRRLDHLGHIKPLWDALRKEYGFISEEETKREIEKRLASPMLSEDERKRLKSHLAFANYMERLNKVKYFNFNGRQIVLIPGQTSGVTLKTQFMWGESLVAVQDRLNAALIYDAANPLPAVTLDNFAEHDFALRADGHIKYPKHGETAEVAREALAINIAKILGFASSDMVMGTGIEPESGEKVPILVTPYAKLTFLDSVTHGVNVKKPSERADSSMGEFNQGSLKPFGSGQFAPDEEMVKDLGCMLGLFMISGDPDGIGKMAQNKALIHTPDGYQVFVFDQVVQSILTMVGIPADTEHAYELDADLTLLPAIKKFSVFSAKSSMVERHYSGRNFSLLNDSKLETRYDALMQMLNKQVEIETYIDREIERLKSYAVFETNPEAEKFIKELQEAKQSIQGRMALIRKALPTGIGLSVDKRTDDLNALALQGMMNRQVMFTDDGRPLRNPKAQIKNKVIRYAVREDGNVVVTFGGRINKEAVSQFRNKVGSSLGSQVKQTSVGDQLIISQEAFNMMSGAHDRAMPTSDGLQQHPRAFNRDSLDTLYAAYHPDQTPKAQLKNTSFIAGQLSSLFSQKSLGSTEQNCNDLIEQMATMPDLNKGFIEHVKRDMSIHIADLLIKRGLMTPLQYQNAIKLDVLDYIVSLSIHAEAFLSNKVDSAFPEIGFINDDLEGKTFDEMNAYATNVKSMPVGERIARARREAKAGSPTQVVDSARSEVKHPKFPGRST